MKLRLPQGYFGAGLLLMAAAAALITVAVLTNRGDITSAAVVIAALVCAVAGIFILTFSGGEPIDPRLVGLFPVGDRIAFCRIAADLGVTGNACFLPGRLTGEFRVMLFNPVAEYTGGNVRTDDSFPMSGPAGIVTVPPSDPLVHDLWKGAAPPWTDGEEDVTRLLRESVCGAFEFASDLSAQWQEETVTITLHGYRFIDGCRLCTTESPRCCSVRPCMATSLCGALIAQSMDAAISLERCSPDASKPDVTAVFTIVAEKLEVPE